MSDDATVPHRVTGSPLKSLCVEVVAGPDAGRSHRAASETLTIGTAPTNDLVLTDPTVSRFHVELSRRGDRISVFDPGSTNGTEVGFVRVERGTIPAGAVLTLGSSSVRVNDGEIIDVETSDDDSLAGIRGRSKEMRRLMARIERVAKTDTSVLLLGETGTGKEVIAKAIHELSDRRERPFETVDCGTLMPTLIASELFGHEKGAFTGADAQHIGAFERANGGTLFLDELGELPPPLQAALLGALERRSFRRLGGQTPINVDVRVICATNRDLRGEVNSGTFRQDLYYRIAVVLVAIPALRERPADIPLLVEHFLRECGHDGRVEEVIPPEVMASLRGHAWPGNVRELRNFVEAALATGETPALSAEAAARGGPASAATFPSVPLGALFQRPYKDARNLIVGEFERLYFEDLLVKTRSNVSEASRISRMNRTYLVSMLKRHGLR